jgi:hypothetical protein
LEDYEILLVFLASFCACAFNLNAQSEIVDKSTGEVFPKTITFESDGKQYQLEATGVATRKKLIIKVYSIAHYLQKGVAADIQNIMSDANAKQFTLKWVHEASADKVQNAFQESFHKVFTPEKYDGLKNEINRFLQFFNQDAKINDEYILRWIPGGHIEVLINGKKMGSVTNQEFAAGVWNIWLGQKSVVDSKELLSH